MFASAIRRLAPVISFFQGLLSKIARRRRFQLFAALVIGTFFGAIGVGLIGADEQHGGEHHGAVSDHASVSMPYAENGDGE